MVETVAEQEFHRDLMAEDVLGRVVRAHIHVEAVLVELINLMVPFPNQLPKLAYEGRVRLACALGLSVTLLDPLKKLGDIRNSFSHNLRRSLDEAQISELYKSMSQEMRDIVVTAYNDLPLEEHIEADFFKLKPESRFIFLVVVIKNSLDRAVIEFHERFPSS